MAVGERTALAAIYVRACRLNGKQTREAGVDIYIDTVWVLRGHYYLLNLRSSLV